MSGPVRSLKLARMPELTQIVASVVGSVFNLDGRPHYLHTGWFLISVPNLIIILLMIAVFALAIALPFPHGRKKEQ